MDITEYFHLNAARGSLHYIPKPLIVSILRHSNIPHIPAVPRRDLVALLIACTPAEAVAIMAQHDRSGHPNIPVHQPVQQLNQPALANNPDNHPNHPPQNPIVPNAIHPENQDIPLNPEERAELAALRTIFQNNLPPPPGQQTQLNRPPADALSLWITDLPTSHSERVTRITNAEKKIKDRFCDHVIDLVTRNNPAVTLVASSEILKIIHSKPVDLVNFLEPLYRKETINSPEAYSNAIFSFHSYIHYIYPALLPQLERYVMEFASLRLDMDSLYVFPFSSWITFDTSVRASHKFNTPTTICIPPNFLRQQTLLATKLANAKSFSPPVHPKGIKRAPSQITHKNTCYNFNKNACPFPEAQCPRKYTHSCPVCTNPGPTADHPDCNKGATGDALHTIIENASRLKHKIARN